MSPPVKRGLGKGLDALFTLEKEAAQSNVSPHHLPINMIDPNPLQARKVFDEDKLRELSESIGTYGLLQPILVTPRGDRYLLVAGERRWRAARMAQLTQVPALVMTLDDQEVAEVSLVENLQRDDLNPLEEAEGIAQLMTQFSLTQEQAAQRIGGSRPAVANALRLLQLAEPVQDLVRHQKLSAGHARALAGVHDSQEQINWAQASMEQDMTVRQLEAALRKQKKPQQQPTPPQENGPDFTELEDSLMRILGTRVTIQGTLDKGRVILEYFQRDDLERINEWAQSISKIQ